MREEYRRGEFEARQRQLPADLNQTAMFTPLGRARTEFDATPIGTPPVCYDVRSVFESRPVNAYDFHITNFQAVDSTNSSALVEMTVPDGYACILRGIEIWFEPTPIGVNRSTTYFSLTLNGGEYPNNTGILIGADSNGLIPMFMLADEFNRVGARIIFPVFDDSAVVYVHFYGNFLLKTERALPFEVANPSNDPNCKSPTQRRLSEPPRPSTPTPASTPTPTVQAQPILPTPVTPAPQAVAHPSFPIQWRAAGGGNNAQLIPMQNDRGQRRDLSVSEVRKYFTFLNDLRQRGSAKEREMWNNYLRAVGVQ